MLLLTFGAAFLARRQANFRDRDEQLAGRKLNRWLIGLSAGTTGNSGFIVTGAVGLGYAGGAKWLLLPISWMIGDLVYWYFFPARLNRLASVSKALTLPELLTFNLPARISRAISIIASILIITFLGMYVSAQWLAGQKFLTGVFEFSRVIALVLFALIIVAYTGLGGFRGSVYVDVLQAIIRIIGTVIALAAVTSVAHSQSSAFVENISNVGSAFLAVFPSGGLIAALAFISGFAFASIGFGLGQPQIVSRYMAGASPEETRAAWWIYIGFIQFTWIAMTTFGIILRGVMPNISDPETGLSIFFQSNMPALITGMIVADVFATIASTSNGILVAISQTIVYALAPADGKSHVFGGNALSIITLSVGLITIVLSLVLPGNVFSIALDAVSMLGAALAAPVMIKAFAWKHTGSSLLAAMILGLIAAIIWKSAALDQIFNEAGIGLAFGLFTNWLFYRIQPQVRA
jgi:Na+/proline symporter